MKSKIDDKNEPIIILKDIDIPKTREGGGGEKHLKDTAPIVAARCDQQPT